MSPKIADLITEKTTVASEFLAHALLACYDTATRCNIGAFKDIFQSFWAV